jgi:hypothetical protein
LVWGSGCPINYRMSRNFCNVVMCAGFIGNQTRIYLDKMGDNSNFREIIVWAQGSDSTTLAIQF